MQQLDLILTPERLPKRPYCTDDLGSGVRVRAAKQALRARYVQLNPPHLVCWLTLDIDRAGGAVAWEDSGLAVPSWAAANRENGHAHITWGLSAPVLTTEAARQGPLRYLDALRRAYTESAQADRHYSGLITKNPAHGTWRTLYGTPHLYDLAELAEYVDLAPFKYQGRQRADQVGIGRNVSLFETTRHWSYTAVRLYRGPGRAHFAVWEAEVLAKVQEYNGDFPEPLPFSELKAIAKSIAKWTWQRDPSAQAAFSARQSARGKKGGRPGLGEPWLDLGISRRTYFRKRASGLIVPGLVDN